MNVAPAHQAPYRAEIIIRSAGAIVHTEVLMVTSVAECETESGFTVACLTAERTPSRHLDAQRLRQAARLNAPIRRTSGTTGPGASAARPWASTRVASAGRTPRSGSRRS